MLLCLFCSHETGPAHQAAHLGRLWAAACALACHSSLVLGGAVGTAAAKKSLDILLTYSVKAWLPMICSVSSSGE